MITSITFQGLQNFAANLYALEVKSRFIDQSKAHGFYTGYGTELSASAIGSNVVVGTGAFVVCGRMGKVVSDESVPVTVVNGQVGYIVAHLETYHLSDDFNIRFIAKTGASLAAIPLTQEDIYADDAETTNKVFEFPIYSFTMSGGSIQNLVKTLSPVADYATIKQIADAAKSAADNAVLAAQTANKTAGDANTAAVSAVKTAGDADKKSDDAVSAAGAAVSAVNDAVADITRFKSETTQTVEQLAEQIGDRQGTTIKSGGVALSTLDLDVDILNIFGGGA